MTPYILFALALALASWGVYRYFNQKNMANQRLIELREQWGSPKRPNYSMSAAQALFKQGATYRDKNSYTLDQGTWEDLDMDTLFSLINQTQTPLGGQYLYDLLRHPELSEKTLKEREAYIKAFQDQDLRESVQMVLWSLEHEYSKHLVDALWMNIPEKSKAVPWLAVLAFSNIFCLFYSFIDTRSFIFVFLITATNFFVRSHLKKEIKFHLYALQYLGPMIQSGQRLTQVKSSILSPILKELVQCVSDVKMIPRQVFASQVRDDSGFIEYFNILLLWDVMSFYSALDNIKKNLASLKTIHQWLGALDAFISIASLRHQRENLCIPVFQSEYVCEALYTPILEEPVPNSFSFFKSSATVSGSNMAGKTTFLKTLGSNAILAQSIHTCFAQNYKAPFLQVMTSINRMDSLQTNTSYYMAEVESVLRLIRASEKESSFLFIIDEIFRGTNSEERLAASIAVLTYLANDKDFILVSTHDLALVQALDELYNHFHFREQFTQEGLTFDYKIHPGVSVSRNAIALLSFVGYPQGIVDQSNAFLNAMGATS